ncbi:hypothetical protein R84B8_01599 [Treponema sp. R8-4-B8]
MKQKYFLLIVLVLICTGCGTLIEEAIDTYNYGGEIFIITFINNSDYDISFKKKWFMKDSVLEKRSYDWKGPVPRVKEVKTYGKYREASDYDFTYDKTKVEIYDSHSNTHNYLDYDPYGRTIAFVNIEDARPNNYGYNNYNYDNYNADNYSDIDNYSEFDNDNPIDTRLTTPGEISDLDELNYEQSNTNTGQTNTNTRQTVKTVSIPLYLTENSSLSHNTITAYIMSKNPSMSRQDVERLINTYILEAQKESINYEIAIAQMLYATKFLKNRKLLVTHDYMGLNNGNKYNNMTEGVRAHIRYLKEMISNLDESLTTWASKNIQYTKNIVIILYELNNYSIN